MFAQRAHWWGSAQTTGGGQRRLTTASLLEVAQAELDVAGTRRADIDREMAKQQKIIDDLAAQRKNKGRGRPSTTHASKVKDAESVRPAVQAIVRQGGLVEATSGLGEASEGKESDES
mgnify:CR=1 FL=1